MKPAFSLPRRTHRNSAFTLVEMLAVIAIIAVVLAIGFGARNITGGQGTTAAVANTEALFADARALAVGRSTNAAVLVDLRDVANTDHYLRRVTLAYYDNENSRWTLTGRAYHIPGGVFFSQEFSEPSEITTLSLYNEAGTEMSGFSGNWAKYEFNSQGIFRRSESASSDFPGAFVVGSGQRMATNSNPTVTAAAVRDFDGFAIWRSGRTSKFQSPDQIPGVTNINFGDSF